MEQVQDDSVSAATRGCYNASAVAIFCVMSYCFLFPVNKLIPLDRRTISILCSVLCYITRTYVFSHQRMDVVEAIDFDVLVLLASIMAINHIVVHLKETSNLIHTLQNVIKIAPLRGFWMVSIASFVISPFLTNDGVCLLFVEPILQSFDVNDESDSQNELTSKSSTEQNIHSDDAIYFMLTLACSANIGSALTYTGNPQNMLVSEDAIFVLPSYQFTLYMLLPSLVTWLITTKYIEWCWKKAIESRQKTISSEDSFEIIDDTEAPEQIHQYSRSNVSVSCFTRTCNVEEQPKSPLSPLTPKRKAAKKIAQRDQLIEKVVSVVISPFPYMIILLLLAMIVLIFVDVMPISGLVCVTAIVMVVTLVVGNHWRGRKILSTKSTEDASIPLSDEEKIDNMNEFFEELFNSLDYSLLIIFLGTFIVVANIQSTGIPSKIWDAIVGKVPFKTFGSILGISSFVLIASQFLGNVAIIQLAKPNIEYLADDEKRYAWAVISFVATIGGNLTLTGSAANIIVAEKSSRISPSASIDFFSHFKICFAVTLLSCFIGGLIISMMMMSSN